MKKAPGYRVFVSILLALVLVAQFPTASQATGLSSLPGLAVKTAGQVQPGAGFRYVATGKEITILGCATVCPRSAVIPRNIGSGVVVTIGAGAFKNARIEHVTIPDSVRNIKEFAFEGSSLESVSLGKSLQFIGVFAFASTSLKSVSLGNSVKAIARFAFAGNFLEEITLPASITRIENEAFASNRLVSATFLGDAPAESKEVFNWDFKKYKGGTNKVGTIVVSVLKNARGWGKTWSGIPVQKLESTDFLSYTTKSKKVEITGCKKTCPKILVIPNKIAGNPVTSIASRSFKDAGLSHVVLPKTITKIGDSSFSGDLLTDVFFTGSAPALGLNSFASISKSTKVRLAWNSDNWGDMWAGNKLEVDNSHFFTSEDEYGNLTIRGCRGNCASNLVFPSKIGGKPVRTLGRFYNPAGILSVKIPDSVTAIGDQSFMSNKLTEVEIPKSVVSIGENAFAYNEITSVKLSSQITSPRGAFKGNKISKIDIPSSWKEIPNEFLAHNLLTKIDLPEKLEIIGESAFIYNKISAATIPKSIKEIKDMAFFGNKLTKLPTLPVGSVFKNWYSGNPIKSLVIPDRFTVLDNHAFDSMGLTSVTIPDSITSIGLAAFQNNLLETVTIPKSVTSMASLAFHKNKLKSLIFEGDAPTVLTGPQIYPWLGPSDFPKEPNMFRDNSSLTKVTVKAGTSGWGTSWSGLTVKVVP